MKHRKGRADPTQPRPRPLPASLQSALEVLGKQAGAAAGQPEGAQGGAAGAGPTEQAGFDKPSAAAAAAGAAPAAEAAAAAAPVKDLGVVGRGTKRLNLAPVQVRSLPGRPRCALHACQWPACDGRHSSGWPEAGAARMLDLVSAAGHCLPASRLRLPAGRAALGAAQHACRPLADTEGRLPSDPGPRPCRSTPLQVRRRRRRLPPRSCGRWRASWVSGHWAGEREDLYLEGGEEGALPVGQCRWRRDGPGHAWASVGWPGPGRARCQGSLPAGSALCARCTLSALSAVRSVH